MLILILSARFAFRGGCALALFTHVAAALAALLSSLPAPPVRAQAVTLAPVVVTGSREPLPLDRLVGDVTVIDAQRIRESSADSLEALLSREGGVALSRNGAVGQIAGVMLRGSSPSSVVVLIDGVRIGSATVGQADLSALSLGAIERIEILRGPGSSLYGSDAVGGVVQIVTRRGEGPPSVAARAAVGEQRSSEADVSVSGAGGGVSALRPGDAFGNHNPDRDGFRRTSAHLRAGLAVAPGQRIGANVQQYRLRSQYDASEFVPPTFAQDATPDFRNRFDVRLAALDYRATWSPQWTSTLQASEQRDDSVAGATQPDRFRTERRQWTLQSAFTPVPRQQLVGAIERLREAVESSSFTAGQQRTNTALVLGYTGALGAHRLQVDVRNDHNATNGNVRTGKLGWATSLADGITLRALGTAFRGPTFNDLYFPGFGVPTIRPERSRSVEMGVQWQDAQQSASATLYHNRVRDLIGFQPDRSFCPADPAYNFGCAANVSRATLKGVTLSAAQRLGDFGVRATLDFLDATDNGTGRRLVRRAAHWASAVADWTRGPWSADATLVAVGARPEGGATLPAYETLDLQLRYRLSPAWRLETKWLNVLDRDYQPARDYQSVGRQIWLGVRFQGAAL
jgi:vitamin B12 transporter